MLLEDHTKQCLITMMTMIKYMNVDASKMSDIAKKIGISRQTFARFCNSEPIKYFTLRKINIFLKSEGF